MISSPFHRGEMIIQRSRSSFPEKTTVLFPAINLDILRLKRTDQRQANLLPLPVGLRNCIINPLGSQQTAFTFHDVPLCIESLIGDSRCIPSYLIYICWGSRRWLLMWAPSYCSLDISVCALNAALTDLLLAMRGVVTYETLLHAKKKI